MLTITNIINKQRDLNRIKIKTAILTRFYDKVLSNASIDRTEGDIQFGFESREETAIALSVIVDMKREDSLEFDFKEFITVVDDSHIKECEITLEYSLDKKEELV